MSHILKISSVPQKNVTQVWKDIRVGEQYMTLRLHKEVFFFLAHSIVTDQNLFYFLRYKQCIAIESVSEYILKVK